MKSPRSILEYPVVVRKHAKILIISLPDLGISEFQKLPENHLITKNYVTQIAQVIIRVWVKGTKHVQEKKWAPNASDIRNSTREFLPQEVSALKFSQTVGVCDNTIKRWIKKGIIPAKKTSGGHFHIAESETPKVLSLKTNRKSMDPTKRTSLSDLPQIDPGKFEDTETDLLNNKLFKALKYPLVIKKQLDYLVISIPDLSLFETMEAPESGRISAEWQIQLAVRIGRVWVKSLNIAPPTLKPSNIRGAISRTVKEEYTVCEFAKLVKLSSDTIRRDVDKGIISARKTSGGHRRIPSSQLQLYIAILNQEERKVEKALEALRPFLFEFFPL